jgi:arsenite methyltransferase
MSHVDPEDIREAVRKAYGKIATSGETTPAPPCCGTMDNSATMPDAATGCCSQPEIDFEALARINGYEIADRDGIPQGADMGLGCGNPLAMAALKPGETVVDLGSGGGFDCFLAARQVGETGRIIGVDMTPEMVAKARKNADKSGMPQVEFRLGEIEHLPVADNSADLVMSNCVINLSPNKQAVFIEVYRVLKPGGRLSISDILATAPLPESVQKDLALRAACIGGAETIHKTRELLEAAGFRDILIKPNPKGRELLEEWNPEAGGNAGDYVVSTTITAVKPA